jgi:hypothetical protein
MLGPPPAVTYQLVKDDQEQRRGHAARARMAGMPTGIEEVRHAAALNRDARPGPARLVSFRLALHRMLRPFGIKPTRL